MIILVDTREQAPLEFNHPMITEVRRQKLEVGDYAVLFKDGSVPSVFFERKSIGDLYGTLGKGYKRFKREIQKVLDKKWTMIIIIEGSLTKVLKGYKHSTLEGISIVKKLMTLWIRYGIRPVFCSNREEMSEFITNFFIGVGNEYVLRNHNAPKSSRNAPTRHD